MYEHAQRRSPRKLMELLPLQLALELPMIFFDVLGCSKSADG
jgi:hypothetical protein